jgi:hypothetical protein
VPDAFGQMKAIHRQGRVMNIGFFPLKYATALAVLAASCFQIPAFAQPVITHQPESRGVLVGHAVSLSVTATGAALQFQWRKDGSNLLGATSLIYSITNAQNPRAVSVRHFADAVGNAGRRRGCSDPWTRRHRSFRSRNVRIWSGLSNFECTTDFANQEIRNFGGARDRFAPPRFGIPIDGMGRSFTLERTAMRFQVSNQFPPLHESSSNSAP